MSDARDSVPASLLEYDEQLIRSLLDEATDRRLEILDLLGECESSNAELLAVDAPAPGRIRVLIAEHQTAGRGRRGGAWQSPPGSGLCLSIAFRFGAEVAMLPALPLVLGVASRRALQDLGVRGVGLKWPNDLMADGKLAGLLVELRGHTAGDLHVVAGIGINVCLPPAVVDELSAQDNGVTDLNSLSDTPPDRNQLAAAIIGRWSEAISLLIAHGLEPFAAEWAEADICRGRKAVLVSDQGKVTGTCCGIDEQGRLLFDVDGRIQRLIVGDISLRLTPMEKRHRDLA